MRLFFILLLILNHDIIFSQQTPLEWDLLNPVNNQWISAGTHGSVQEALIRNGNLPDPFYGENESKFAWIEKHDWKFVSSITLSAEQLTADFIELEFPGVDTYARIYLNDVLVLETDNAFRPYRLQVKGLVHPGKNSLEVVFTSPVNYHRKAFKAMSPKLPAPNDVGEIAVSSMSRKPQYQFGWDWALRMNTMGFTKPVVVHAYNKNRIVLRKVDTKFIEDNEAILNLSVTCAVKQSMKVNLKSDLFGIFKDFKMTDGVLNIPVAMENPQLWWPRGQGGQFLYTDKWLLTDSTGAVIDNADIRFGIKTSELIQEKDEWGTGFYLKINGRPIFCKGANYIPQDVFPARITDASIRNMVAQMEQSNFNMVRIWGGGFYQEEALYNACDEAGIMVWQDLMFACAMYPGDEKFLSGVREELNYQVPRISAHPSLVLFNGNNEVDVAWKNWGFQTKYMIGQKAQKAMEKDYDNLFKVLAPEVISAKSSIPYVHTSPLSNWGNDEFYQHGTQHYWGVWHGKDPIEDFGLKSGRFNAEYGFQSFPEYATLSAFSTKADWDLNSPLMKHRQKSYVGNGMIKKHADILYGSAKSFEDFVYYSQLTQAKAVGIAISSHRLDTPRCMGTLYWQLNDSWPAPTWSAIDYFGNWKALQYEVKDDFEDVAVLARTEKIGNEHFFLISDQPENFETNLRYSIYDLQGQKLLEKNERIFIHGNFQQEICLECRTEEYMHKNYVISFEWQNAKGDTMRRTFNHLAQKYQRTPEAQVKLSIENIDTEAGTASLRIKTSGFVKDFWVFSSRPGVKFEQNFLTLLPGEHVIRITFETFPELIDFGMKWL